MPVEELNHRAHMLRERLLRPISVPDHKSLNQMREEAIMEVLSEVADEARDAALREEIYAVGKTPEEAVKALAKSQGWGDVTDFEPLEGGEKKFTWSRRFLADGTGMKVAGWEVPGGVVLTWWK